MNWDSVEGEWKQRRGKAVQHWGKMMNDELAAIAGKYEALVGELQERYGIAREEARGHAALYKDTVEQLKLSRRKLIELQKSMTRAEKSGPARIKKSGRKHTRLQGD
jgi:uncharacterized protein YjbJ (UPF0337 family)